MDVISKIALILKLYSWILIDPVISDPDFCPSPLTGWGARPQLLVCT